MIRGASQESRLGIVLLAVALLVAACAGPGSVRLVAPQQRHTPESRSIDIRDCRDHARATQYFLLDEKDQALLAGKDTVGFLRGGVPAVDGSTMTPVRVNSAFRGASGLYGPKDLDDRYVLCLMKKGYRWEEGSG